VARPAPSRALARRKIPRLDQGADLRYEKTGSNGRSGPDYSESQKVLSISTTDGSHPTTGTSPSRNRRSHRIRIRIRHGIHSGRNGHRNGRHSVRSHHSARIHTW
jgi:hypothetical protein